MIGLGPFVLLFLGAGLLPSLPSDSNTIGTGTIIGLLYFAVGFATIIAFTTYSRGFSEGVRRKLLYSTLGQGSLQWGWTRLIPWSNVKSAIVSIKNHTVVMTLDGKATVPEFRLQS